MQPRTMVQNYAFTLRPKTEKSEGFINASVSVGQKNIKTDSIGNAVCVLPAGSYLLTITSVNHYPFSTNILVKGDTVIQATMQVRKSLLRNVTVSNSRNITRNQMSAQPISGQQLRKLPVILGEVDPLKTIALLPGIKNGGEILWCYHFCVP